MAFGVHFLLLTLWEATEFMVFLKEEKRDGKKHVRKIK